MHRSFTDAKPKQINAAGNEHVVDFDEALSRLGEPQPVLFIRKHLISLKSILFRILKCRLKNRLN